MIQEVLQQASTTVTIAASQMDFKSEIQFWFTIVGSGVAFVLGAIKIWEWWTSRKGKWLNLLVPKLRDIRALMKTDHFIEASDLYHKEIHAKGFEPVLDRISGHVDREHHLPSLFFRLWILLGYRRHDSEREEPMTVTKDLADTCSRIVVQIDRILDKSKSA